MTNLTKTAVLAISLSLLSASFLLPSAIAQTETTTAPAATTAAKAPAKKKANAKKRAKLKKQASQIIEKGVEKANANVTK